MIRCIQSERGRPSSGRLVVNPDRGPPVKLSPQKRKEKTLHAQLAQVEGLAAQQPVLMVWEDVHWSDPTTRESLDLLIDRVATLRVLECSTGACIR
jgi:predicted ATPase